MSRDEFMRELEYLLQDISEEDKADAVQYYRDYFEEAGPEREAEVVREFGSPERIAAIIRSDIAGNLEAGGEFTERGYEDERFRDPNYQMTKRMDLPEVGKESDSGPGVKEMEGPRTSKLLKVILWIVLIITAVPSVFGIGGGLVGIIGGLLGILAALVISIAAVTVAFLIAGVVLLIFGIVTVVVHPLNGILILGIGILLLGIGILALALAVLFYGKFIPFLFRGIVNAISRLFHRKRG